MTPGSPGAQDKGAGLKQGRRGGVNDELDEAAQTAAEHVAAAASEPGPGAKARASRPAALEPDTPAGVCANCSTPLQGPVCHNCGQLADVFHRPVRGLLSELVEGLFALDGRVARTLPNLLGRPGRITRDYLKGKRARYMTPFRLYIIASLIFFLLIPGIDQVSEELSGQGSAVSDALNGQGQDRLGNRIDADIEAAVAAGDLTGDEAEAARANLARLGLGPSADRQAEPSAPAQETDRPAATPAGEDPDRDIASIAEGADAGDVGVSIDFGRDASAIRRYFAPEDFGEPAPDSWLPLPVRRYLGERFAEVRADPGGWAEAAADWVPRIMFVMVPVYALLLSLTYAWRRRFFFFDHLIVSMHFHSALFLVMAAALLIGSGWAVLAVLVYSNIYLYRLQRVVYARGRFSSVVRTLALDLLYFFVLAFGFIAVLLLGALAG